MRCEKSNYPPLKQKAKPNTKTLPFSIIWAKRLGEEMVWGRIDQGMEAKQLGVKNKGETTSEETTGGGGERLGAKLPVTNFTTGIILPLTTGTLTI